MFEDCLDGKGTPPKWKTLIDALLEDCGQRTLAEELEQFLICNVSKSLLVVPCELEHIILQQLVTTLCYNWKVFDNML